MLRQVALTAAALTTIAAAAAVAYTVYQRHFKPIVITPALNDDGTETSATATTIVHNYALNEVSADKHYRDHSFRVRGTILGVTRDGGRATAILDGGAGQVLARLRSDDDAMPLRAGEVARLNCIGDGVGPQGPRLRECILAP